MRFDTIYLTWYLNQPKEVREIASRVMHKANIYVSNKTCKFKKMWL